MQNNDIHNREGRIASTRENISQSDKISDYNTELLLGDFAQYLQSSDKSLSRRTRYLQNWKDMAEHIDWRLDEPSRDRVERLYNDYKEGKVTVKDSHELSGWQIYEAKKTIRQFFVHFLENRGIVEDGEKFITFTMTPPKDKPDPETVLRPEDVAKFIKYSSERSRDQLYFALTWATAGRCREMLNLTWGDITLSRIKGRRVAKVTLRRKVKAGDETKTITRNVPIREGYAFIKKRKQEDPLSDNPDAFVFRPLNSLDPEDGLSYGGITSVRDRALARIPDEEWNSNRKTNLHNFRHSRATFWAAHGSETSDSQGMNESQIRELGGWSDHSSTVRHYIHLGQEDLDEAVLNFHGLEPEEEDDDEFTIAPVACPECNTLNPFTQTECKTPGCDRALNTASLQEERWVEETAREVAFEVAESEADVDRTEIEEVASELVKKKSDEGEIPI